VPQTSVLADTSGSFVLAIGAGNALSRRAITLGGADRDGLLVTAGLRPGERIVASAGAFLHEGEHVVVAAPASGAVVGGSGGGGAADGNGVAAHVSTAVP